MASAVPLNLVIRAKRAEAVDVVSIDLCHPAGDDLPLWQPGAHIDLHLPSGNVRSYSLCGDPDDRSTYRVAVLRSPDGRGGSVEVHEIAEPGTKLAVGGPRNSFALQPAEHYLFVAGGIGVTPLLPMVRSVAAAGGSWSLLYGGRSRSSMAFVAELQALRGGDLQIVAQDEAGLPDLDGAFAGLPPNCAVYCCGPTALIDAVVAVGERLRPDVPVLLERFTAATDAVREGDTSFEVTLARSGVTLEVPPGRSVLEVVREVVPKVMSSCEEGLCSACETEVLDGIPDHRDSVLTAAEHASNSYMMICVSRARTEKLVLDL